MMSLIRIAIRNVLRNRRRSLLTLLAVFLALAVMVGIRGFLNGLQSTIRESVIYGQTGALQVHRKGFLQSMQGATLELDLPADEQFLAKISAVPGVKAVAPRIPFGGMINANDNTAFAVFMALDPARERFVCPRRDELISTGKPLDPSNPTGGVFSVELLHRIGVKVGDKGTAILTNDRDGVLNAVDIGIAAQLGEKGLPMPEKKFGWVPLALAQELLRMPGRATEIAIGVDDINQVDEVAARVRTAIGPEYEVSTWHDVAAFVDDIIRNQNIVLMIISLAFGFIAFLGIVNTMLMSVLERTREIGTMMAVGVRRREVLGLFLIEAAVLGLAGGIGGLALGGGFVAYYARHGISITFAGSTTPMHIFPFIHTSFILLTFVIAASGAAIAALLPALRASRLRPVEALASV